MSQTTPSCPSCASPASVKLRSAKYRGEGYGTCVEAWVCVACGHLWEASRTLATKERLL